MNASTQPQLRWFHLTPGRFVLALLAVEVLLWLSGRFGWPGWHKGYAVLTSVASVGVAMVLMLVWFGVALVFRRRFQFSLRSLLVLVVVVAVPCSWLAVEMKKADEQKTAVEAILKSGGWVRYDYEMTAAGEYLAAAKPPGLTWLRGLHGNDFFVDVVRAGHEFLHPTLLDDAGLTHVEKLRHIQVLVLGCGRVTDAGLSHIKNLTELQCLDLDRTQVTDNGLAHVRNLRQLTFLDLADTEITDSGLEDLHGMARLQLLRLGGTKVTDAGVARLQKALPNCEITR